MTPIVVALVICVCFGWIAHLASKTVLAVSAGRTAIDAQNARLHAQEKEISQRQADIDDLRQARNADTKAIYAEMATIRRDLDALNQLKEKVDAVIQREEMRLAMIGTNKGTRGGKPL